MDFSDLIVIIAESEFIFHHIGNGSKMRAMISIEKPEEHAKGGFGCGVTIPFDHKRHEIFGEDSLQALFLGVSFLRCRLEDWLSKGNKIYYVNADCQNGGNEEVSKEEFKALFG